MPRLGVMEYMLGRPLIQGLLDAEDVEIVTDVPSVVTDALLSGELDAGLIPIVPTLMHDGLYVVDGPGVACEGPVESIRLYHRCPLPEVKTLALDTSSRTSVVLAQVILRERYGVAPSCIHHEPDLPAMLERADAALLIGDPAFLAGDAVPYVDLGAEWYDMTGLPFVFALWTMRTADRALAARLQRAWREGTAAIEGIAREEAARRGLPVERLQRYLGESMHYCVDGRKKQGIERFITLAERHGLLDTGGRRLRFVGA